MGDLRELLERADRAAARVPLPDDAFLRLTRARNRRRRNERIVSAAAAVALTVGAVFVLLPIARRGVAPADLGPFHEIPAFQATVDGVLPPSATEERGSTGSAFRLEIAYRDASAWRIDVVEADGPALPAVAGIPLSPRSFAVYDGSVLRAYDADDDLVYKQEIARTFSPAGLFGWDAPGAPWRRFCEEGDAVGTESVGGRETAHLRCPASGSFGDAVEIWVDVETGLVMRIVSHGSGGRPTPVAGPIGFFPGEGLEVTSIEYRPVFAEEAFRFEPPPGAEPSEPPERESGPPFPTSLEIGERAPAWTVPLLEGGDLDLTALRGRPALLYFWADWCPPCVGKPLESFHALMRDLGGSLNTYSLAYLGERSAIRAFLDEHGYRAADVALAGTEVERSWRIRAVPLLVALDENGRFIGAYAGPLVESDLQRVADALLAGAPLPHVGGSVTEQIR